MVGITYEVKGLDAAIAGLREFEASMRDWAPFHRVLDPLIDRSIAARFEAQGKPAWEALSPAYAARKARTFPGKPILEATGTMKTAATHPSAAHSVRRSTPTTLERGVDLPYARAQHYGYDKRNLPARPYMLADADDEKAWGEAQEVYARARLLRALHIAGEA